MGKFQNGYGAGIDAARPYAETATIPANTTGIVYTLPRRLGDNTIIGLLTNDNGVTLNTSTGAVSLTTAVGSGVQKHLAFTEIAPSGAGYVRTLTLTAVGISIVIPPLALSAATVLENSAPGTVIGAILNAPGESSYTLLDGAGGKVALDGANLVCGATNIDYEAATSFQVTVQATHPNAPDPRNQTFTINVQNVYEQPSLSALSLSASTFYVGRPATGAILGAIAGEAITAADLPLGLTINGPARTWSWDGTGTVGNFDASLTGSLADSPNSPRTSPLSLSVGKYVLSYRVIDDFETLTNRSATSGTFALTATGAIHGTNAMLLTGTGSNPLMNTNAFNTEDPSSWDLIAIYADFGNDIYNADIPSLLPSFTIGSTSYRYAFDALTGQQYQAIGPHTKGKQWFAFKANRFRANGTWAGQKMTELTGTQSKMSRIDTGVATGTCGMGKVTVDAMVLVERHKPSVILSFDDNNGLQYTAGFPMLAARGFKGTIYCAPGLIDAPGRLTTAQLMEMKAAGWAMACDSGPNDEPLTYFPTVEAATANMQSIKDWVTARFGAEGAQHMCYSYAAGWYYSTTVQSYSVTANGTDTVTTSGGTAWGSFYYPGMYVTGANVPANTFVVNSPTANTIKLSKPIPAGTFTLNGIGRLRGQTATCDGSAVVTMSSTAFLVAGMAVSGGPSVPSGTRIQSVDSSTQITVTNTIPASVGKLNFDVDTGAFWGTKMEDALIAIGMKSARFSLAGGIYTGFGIDPNFAMHFPGFNYEALTADAHIAKIQQQIDACSDVNLYQHLGAAPTDSYATFNSVLDYLKARQDAGEVDVVTVSEWWTKVQQRGAFV
ncbi:hypothetical protein [Novosphingobium sp. KACC 22771]|uniref:hypothetical protein n=1 Tax=Novosphingobium sp. KACC 22771 TaxID=3025670 RepID=UPI0023660EBC|nr:hypothetical protein [Novosphingobium sp. KACC 22771]WDF73473.1 hypothetical protein PQ467_05355 [Novosphingobium sp. KACC 22771]